ncbi:glycosyltransferase family 2 protein [Paenibacillus thiaminolyticus]|uniref:glycosyltransferase n=1 Tax=Paenibacillus thiaminolyticus TaxID=49283 RepID=UPI0035A73459
MVGDQMERLFEKTGEIKKKKALLLKEVGMEDNSLTRLINLLNIERKSSRSSREFQTFKNRKQVHRTVDYKSLQHSEADLEFFERVKKEIVSIPESNGCKYYKKLDVNIAIISDEFMLNYYKDAANFIYLDYRNYKIKLKKQKIDLFLFVTSWKGLYNEWVGIGSSETKKHELYEVIDYLKAQGIPTVFQSIEDPSNYENFIEVAKRCDFVFTSAIEKVDEYKKDCLNDNVWVMEFGVNPLFHNPIGFQKKKIPNEIIFAGSWASRYKERCEDMVNIFDGVIASDKTLRIIDRNFDLEVDDYFYPEKYLKFCSPAISHRELQKTHKLYNWAINLNSIKYSETMCAMRIYELQALGNIILSNYSVAVNNKFPNVFIINDKEEVDFIINSFSDEDIYRHQLLGIRSVMSTCTVFERLKDLLIKCSVIEEVVDKKTILIIAEKLTEKIQNQFNAQTYPYKKIVERAALNKEDYTNYEMITYWDDSVDYFEYYLEDMTNAFKYTNSDFVTKNLDEERCGEHDYVSYYNNKYTTVFWRDSFTFEEITNFDFSSELDNGYRIDNHECKSSQGERSIDESSVHRFSLSVIVPIYNNGRHLLNKCFNSLKRSSIFAKMEVLLIDDGSSDDSTKCVIERLKREYPNVRTYFFNDNGSGSASRPRNKGIELATSEYITFLDPDNEAVNDGYAKLLNEIDGSDYDFVVGHIKKVTDKTVTIRLGHEAIVDMPRRYLLEKKFKAQSIQAAIIRKELIINNNIDMVVGAIGQDTLFFQELMLCSNKMKISNILVHIYYGLVQNSAVNSINKSFFEKSFLLEKSAWQRFEAYGVLEEYKRNKFEHFFINWYLEKYKLVQKSDQKKANEILVGILKLYSSNLKFHDSSIIDFLKNVERDS